jgi:hypothetical protein
MPRLTAAGAAGGGAVLVEPAVCVPCEEAGGWLGEWVWLFVDEGDGVWLEGVLDGWATDPSSPSATSVTVVVPASVNGSLTRLAAPKPTLTDATAKTAQRANSVTLLGTAHLLTCPDRPAGRG